MSSFIASDVDPPLDMDIPDMDMHDLVSRRRCSYCGSKRVTSEVPRSKRVTSEVPRSKRVTSAEVPIKCLVFAEIYVCNFRFVIFI